MKRLNECLNNQYGSYILPFFWQHGDSKEELLEEIIAIEKSGAKEMCVESRVYADFCGEKWWDDFGFILQEAKRRNMRVWLLDDKRFPTGYANGSVEKHPELKKKHIRLSFVDVVGPKPCSAVCLPKIDAVNERLVNIVAYRRNDDCESICGMPLGLIDKLHDGLVFFDIPHGFYRVFFVIETRLGNARYNMIDMLSADSCKLQLEAVYEPHYEHYKEYFGNTFAGFFSDEPCFGNEAGFVDSILGKTDMLVPISDELIDMLSEKMGKDKEYILDVLPILWQKHEKIMHELRYNYMDAVTYLYKRNFSDLLGDWCRELGVMYIGHVIEDNNLHMRLGAGAGHFFRALSGQDMSGCDIVLNQMVPGFNDHTHMAPISAKMANPEFFRYCLAKLAASDSHLDPKKKGRAMCEIFGAFGWAEGVPMMKSLADHFLVSGINHFVPHAFSNRYPNPDCPPHFYIGGKNPQFDMFSKLTVYMQRMCHLLYGGKHVNNVAVLYNCEAEWCSGDYDLFQKVSKILLQNQIDFDFVPSDYLDDVTFDDGGFTINGETFKTIIVSRSSVLPETLIMKLKKLSDNGVEVIFCEQFPTKYSDSENAVDCSSFALVKYSELANALSEYRVIKTSNECKYLRYYHVNNDGKDVYMFCNEDINNEIDTEITLTHSGEYIKYNAWDNSVLYGSVNKKVLKLKLQPSESCVIIFEEHGNAVTDTYKEYKSVEIKPVWNITALDENGVVFTDSADNLYNLAFKLPTFCGKIVYETTINLDSLPERISLGTVGEIATLYVNGKKCSDELYAPYAFDVKDKCVFGANKIIAEVITNLGYHDRDYFSSFLSLPPMGMIGPIKLEY